MFVDQPPKVLRSMYPSLSWEVTTDEKTVYLTFDDGPTQDVTPQVLQLLAKFEAKATFFCLGKNVKTHSDLFQRIKEEGHQVGNHTYGHLNGWKTTTKEYLNDVLKAKEYINSSLFRPPYGRIKPSQIQALKQHFKIVMWSNLTRDYDPTISEEKCLSLALKGLKPGAIIVFHDSLKAKGRLLAVLEKFLQQADSLDYKMKVLSAKALID
jgi:peptidoglycan/xylan/chitin deacetylase (PgdA/CDA1 family)